MKNNDFNDFCYVFDCFFRLEQTVNSANIGIKQKIKKNYDFNDFCYVFDCFFWLESIGNGSKYKNKAKIYKNHDFIQCYVILYSLI